MHSHCRKCIGTKTSLSPSLSRPLPVPHLDVLGVVERADLDESNAWKRVGGGPREYFDDGAKQSAKRAAKRAAKGSDVKQARLSFSLSAASRPGGSS